MKEEIKVALVQFQTRLGNKEHNIHKMRDYIKAAAKVNAKLVVFPEMALTGYNIRDLTYSLAEKIPEGKTVKTIEEIAKKENIFVVFGMPESSQIGESVLYNTAVLIGPNGFVGKYRKISLPTHSIFEEKRYFRSGREIPVFETELGNLGLMICYDIFFPEIARAIRLHGAKIIICISASPTMNKNYFETLTVARAMENTCYLLYVNLVGIENGLQFQGGSCLIGPNGSMVTKAKQNAEGMVIGMIDMKGITPTEILVPVLRDIKPNLYQILFNRSKNL